VRQQVATQREIAGSTTASVGAILSQDSVHAAAIEAVNRLADKYHCERVSLGLRKGLRIALQALSHVARFDSRTQLVRAIEAAMEEAVDQAACIVRPNPPSQEAAISRAHAELSEQHGSGAICTVPLPCESGHIGAITLERAGDKPFDPETVVACQSLASVIGPILAMKQREERPLVFKGIDSVRRLLVTAFGPAHLKLKCLLSLLALLVALLAFVDGSYKVTAPATIQGEVRQLLVAPQDGFIERADIRAGDLVEKGQLIAALDESVHRLEVQKWASQRSKADKAYQEALAKRDRIELSLLRAEIEQLDAELRLAEDKLARTRLEAPFEGVVVSGDLSQSLGAPVETGQVLFEVAPLDRYRVVVEVDEHDVADLEPGLSGQLVVAAFPRKPFAVSVQRVVPVAVTGEGRNFFRVEATLDQPTHLLRPGMSGVAKIEIATRKLLWIWTHDLVERLRLWAWSLRLW
jgi:multidrug resistance efflux pump